MNKSSASIPDITPIIVGVGQHAQRLTDDARPPFTPAVGLAAIAAQAALTDAGVAASEIDTLCMIRLFADSAPAWRSALGGSNNPPESVARRIGAEPARRIYSSSGGTEPLERLAEMFGAIARGESRTALLVGAEAIASERFCARNKLTDDWNETVEAPMDDRYQPGRFALREEVQSGLKMPAHFYALIENAQAHSLGHTQAEHRHYMAGTMATLAAIAQHNPYAQQSTRYTAEDLASTAPENYLISLPLRRRLVAQDAVNQAAALLLTSAGHARELGIDPARWLFLEGYAEGEDRYLLEREDPGSSVAMQRVFTAALDMAGVRPDDMQLLDLYSCFPCAVHAAGNALGLPLPGYTPLTVTGGLPYFGGPGNNYSMHALAEMASRLRGGNARGLVTANGGILSKHAAAVVSAVGGHSATIDWTLAPHSVARESIPAVALCEAATNGAIVTYTVVAGRNVPDLGVIMVDTPDGRCMASSSEPGVTAALAEDGIVGRNIELFSQGEQRHFRFSPA